MFDGAIYITMHASSSLAATDNTNRRGRVKNEKKRPEKASAINCSSIIILYPTSISVTD
jgi:hypothetical protein